MSSVQDDEDGAKNRPGMLPRQRYLEGESTPLDNPVVRYAGEDTPSDNPIYHLQLHQQRHGHRNRDRIRHLMAARPSL